MKKSASLWQLLGFGVVSLSGTLLHFLYEWTGESTLAAAVSGVNESTWEHMKLLFFPLFAYAIAEYLILGRPSCFWKIKLRGTLLGPGLIPVLFYTYNGAIGKSPDWINIAIFFVAAAIVAIFEAKQLNRTQAQSHCRSPLLPFFCLCAIGLLFVLFTYFPPQLAIFRDPVNGSYGIPA